MVIVRVTQFEIHLVRVVSDSNFRRIKKSIRNVGLLPSEAERIKNVNDLILLPHFPYLIHYAFLMLALFLAAIHLKYSHKLIAYSLNSAIISFNAFVPLHPLFFLICLVHNSLK